MKKHVLSLTLCLLMLSGMLPARGAWTCSPTTHAFTVDGRYIHAEIYNIGGYNYFKLRDMAMLLKDTDARFSVEYDSPTKTIHVGTGIEYEPVGGELVIGSDKSATCSPAVHTLKVNGKVAEVQAYNIGGNNFYKLRDLGHLLNFYVGYDSPSDTAIVISSYYIRHTDVVLQQADASVYYEVPVFRGNTPALRKINQEIQTVERDLGDRLRDVRSLFSAPVPPGSLRNTWTAKVDSFSERLVSVTLSYFSNLSGMEDSGCDGYVFDGENGNRLYLTDVLGLTDDQARDAVCNALADQYPSVYSGNSSNLRTTIRAKSIPELDFAVEGGHAVVYFDQYEIAAGSYGTLRVVLPDPLMFV